VIRLPRTKRKSDIFDINALSKRATLSSNKMRGKMAEDAFALNERAQRSDVKRIHIGGDFIEKRYL
jgi:hypothetical protein